MNTCQRGHYRIEKEIVADPLADVVLVRARFVALDGQGARARLYCILEPHLGNCGDDNTALLGSHKGLAMLFAERADGLAVALVCSAPILKATAGFIGSDGRAQLQAHGQLVETYERAQQGNVSLVAEIDHRARVPRRRATPRYVACMTGGHPVRSWNEMCFRLAA